MTDDTRINEIRERLLNIKPGEMTNAEWEMDVTFLLEQVKKLETYAGLSIDEAMVFDSVGKLKRCKEENASLKKQVEEFKEQARVSMLSTEAGINISSALVFENQKLQAQNASLKEQVGELASVINGRDLRLSILQSENALLREVVEIAKEIRRLSIENIGMPWVDYHKEKVEQFDKLIEKLEKEE